MDVVGDLYSDGKSVSDLLQENIEGDSLDVTGDFYPSGRTPRIKLRHLSFRA